MPASCDAWNTLDETPPERVPANRYQSLAPVHEVVMLDAVPAEESERIATGIDEFDRVLGGGGLVEGSVVLIGGDPGIGKSTLLLQALANLSRDIARCST